MIQKNLIQRFKHLNYAYLAPKHNKPTLCFIPGFRSDFTSSKKSNSIYNYSVQQGYGYLSWNHTDDGSVYDWYRDSLDILNKFKTDYIIGASMGLWIGLLVSKEREMKGIVGIGGTINLTERWLKSVPEIHQTDRDFIWKKPSLYDIKGYDEIPIKFLIDSKNALMDLNQTNQRLENIPIYLIHGEKDRDVPIQDARALYHHLSNSNKKVKLYEIPDGDHQLSKPYQLDFINKIVQKMI